MEYRPLGRTGVHVSKLCLGTMMFGAWGNTDHDDSIRIIHRALGCRDQLRRHRRRLLRRRVRGDRRQGAQGPTRRRRAGHEVLGADGRGPQPAAAVSRRWIITEVENSLRRLGTDWIDLYQIHRPDPRHRHRRDPRRADRPRPAGQGPLHRLVLVLRRRDRRGAVGGARAAPGALPHRAAAVLDPRARHRARRAADRPAARHGHPHLQPAGRRLAVRPLERTTRHPPRPRGSDSSLASTCRCPRTSASSKPTEAARQARRRGRPIAHRARDRLRRQPPRGDLGDHRTAHDGAARQPAARRRASRSTPRSSTASTRSSGPASTSTPPTPATASRSSSRPSGGVERTSVRSRQIADGRDFVLSH